MPAPLSIQAAANRCPCCSGALRSIVPESIEWLAAPVRTEGPAADAWRVGLASGWSGDVGLLRCDDCGFLRVDPTPTEATLRSFYSAYHRNADYAAKGSSKLRRASRRIARIARRAHHRGRQRTFLDIGCSIGFACEAARRLGFDVTGTDLDPEAILQARQLFPEIRFTGQTLDALAAEGATFDVVYCAEVIEHVRDPAAFVRAAYTVTEPGGMLYLTTPDAGHWRVPRPIWTWEEVRPPEHICWFTKAALRALLRQAGFVEVRAPFRLKPGLRMTAVRPATA